MEQTTQTDTQPIIRAGDFFAYLDGYALGADPHGYGSELFIWYVSLLGNHESIRAVWARLIKGDTAAIQQGAFGRATYARLAPRDKKGWSFHQVSLPRSAGQHGLLLPKIALFGTEDPQFLLLPAEGEEARLLYRFLNRRVSLPLHPSWADWLWERAERRGELSKLTGYGRRAYLITTDTDALRSDVSRAVREGRLSVEGGITDRAA